jgi:superfamily II RNA helicase
MCYSKLPPLVHLQYDAVTLVDPSADADIIRACELLGTRLKDWQAHAVACLLRQQDLIIKAGTGAGKTYAYWSMIARKENGIALILSPLKSVMSNQVIVRCDRDTNPQG